MCVDSFVKHSCSLTFNYMQGFININEEQFINFQQHEEVHNFFPLALQNVLPINKRIIKVLTT